VGINFRQGPNWRNDGIFFWTCSKRYANNINHWILKIDACIYSFVGFNLVNFGFFTYFCLKWLGIWNFCFCFWNSKNTTFALDSNPIFFGGGIKKRIIHYFYNFYLQRLHFFAYKLVIYNCCYLKIRWSKFATMNSMHTRQSIGSLHFSTVKIKILKHIHVQKNIKAEWFFEILCCREVFRPWEV